MPFLLPILSILPTKLTEHITSYMNPLHPILVTLKQLVMSTATRRLYSIYSRFVYLERYIQMSVKRVQGNSHPNATGRPSAYLTVADCHLDTDSPNNGYNRQR
jgi:hypothetical protein